MLIALLLALGVDLVVIVALVVVVVSRKRWVKSQRGAFPGVIRMVHGEIDGLGPSWSRGYGRWVRDVLVWSKGPFLFRTRLLPTDSLDTERVGASEEVRRLGEHPAMVELAVGSATIEVAVAADRRQDLRGPYGQSAVDASQTTRPG